jgi:hypothetical protein
MLLGLGVGSMERSFMEASVARRPKGGEAGSYKA